MSKFSAPPSPAALKQAVADATNAGTPTSGGALYSLPSDAQTATFDVSGLPGLGTGQMKGSDLLRAFLAAGQSSDPQVRSVAAAIQHALFYGNYYDKSAIPTFGEVSKDDANALGRALNDLYNANQAQVGGSASGALSKMGVSQFLTSQASIGAASGPNGPAQAVAPTVVNVRAPNAADVASTYQKVAQQLLGHRPDAADTAAFVNSYTQQYVSNEKANIQSQYDATVQKAQAKVKAAGSAPYLPAATPAGYKYDGGSAGAAEFGQQADALNHGAYDGGSATAAEFTQNGGTGAPPTLADSMGTLQDVINQQSQAQQGAPALIEAGTNAPEDVGVAAENYARNQHPGEAAAGDLNSTFGTFLSLIGAHMAGV